MRIVLTGGTGQVGTILARHFHRTGHAVTVVSRSGHKVPWRNVQWDGRSLGSWIAELDGADVLINLAGRSVNCRYTQENRRAILESRVLSTQALHQAIAAVRRPPGVWLNASTATIYRHSLDRPMDEAAGELGGGEAGAPETWASRLRLQKPGSRPSFLLRQKRPGRSPFGAP